MHGLDGQHQYVDRNLRGRVLPVYLGNVKVNRQEQHARKCYIY